MSSWEWEDAPEGPVTKTEAPGRLVPFCTFWLYYSTKKDSYQQEFRRETPNSKSLSPIGMFLK